MSFKLLAVLSSVMKSLIPRLCPTWEVSESSLPSAYPRCRHYPTSQYRGKHSIYRVRYSLRFQASTGVLRMGLGGLKQGGTTVPLYIIQNACKYWFRNLLKYSRFKFQPCSLSTVSLFRSNQYHNSKRDMHHNVHCSSIYNSQDMEPT